MCVYYHLLSNHHTSRHPACTMNYTSLKCNHFSYAVFENQTKPLRFYIQPWLLKKYLPTYNFIFKKVFGSKLYHLYCLWNIIYWFLCFSYFLWLLPLFKLSGCENELYMLYILKLLMTNHECNILSAIEIKCVSLEVRVCRSWFPISLFACHSL